MADDVKNAPNRVDGVAKVTGKAKYIAEWRFPSLSYGYLVHSTIAKGKIRTIDASEAERHPGVVKVLTHLNTTKYAKAENDRPHRPLHNADVLFSGQAVALVVAETFEQARYAATLVKIEYDRETPSTDLRKVADKAFIVGRPRPDRGNPEEAFTKSEVKIEAEYTIPIEHHNPMELHGCIALWEGEKLTLFNKTQGVKDVQDHLVKSFGLKPENVQVISPFVGGAFGAALNPHYYPFITAVAARDLKRPVKVNYTRRQMFTGHGYRPYTWQKVQIGASRDGKFQSIIHEAVGNTSTFENFGENPNSFGRTLYECPNYDTPYSLAKLDLPTPTWMRAPGAVSGAFALESAIDELAYELKIDPLELRLINYSEKDPDTGKPWSSKALRDAYKQGAAKFGWEKRKLEPRSMRDGRWLVGWGCATGIWGAMQLPASCKITLKADGTAYVGSATADIGPGTYTVITMIAAEYLGIAPDKIKFELGDSSLPNAPVQGGSFTTASVGTAAHGAALAIKQKLFDLALKEESSPLVGSTVDVVEMSGGYLSLRSDLKKRVSIADLMAKNNLTEISETFTSRPSAERQKYATQAHGAQFVEVKVDEALGIVKVTRVVEATAVGKIMNPKTSHSQEMGGVVWGIGMALHEETAIDHRYGRMMTTDLASYHVPSNADVMSVETAFVEEEDKIVNPLGVKGMGELCMVGIPAAIANAIFHATGKRVRDLPITPDKLL
jgi:xanthine dehydrogenase YagR molybdenum-binding subunit